MAELAETVVVVMATCVRELAGMVAGGGLWVLARADAQQGQFLFLMLTVFGWAIWPDDESMGAMLCEVATLVFSPRRYTPPL